MAAWAVAGATKAVSAMVVAAAAALRVQRPSIGRERTGEPPFRPGTTAHGGECSRLRHT